MRIVSTCLLLLVAGASFAQAPTVTMNYNFADFRYVDVDGGDGFSLGGSYQFNNNWVALGAIERLNFGGGVDATNIELGAGYIWPFQADWDLVANARIIRSDVDSPFGGADDTGLGLAAGTRGFIAPKFEVRGGVHYVNVSDSDVFLEIAGDYYFTPSAAAGLSLEFGGDVDVWTLGVRWFFR